MSAFKVQLRANIQTNLRFYKRNKLILAAAIIIFGFIILMTLFSFQYRSANSGFSNIVTIFHQLNGFLYSFSCLMALFYMHHHFQNRSLKMILTKPCPPETWLLSVFLTPLLFCFAIQIIILLGVTSLCFATGIPYQYGFIYSTFYYFLKCAMLISFTIFLTMLMHAVVTVLVLLIFRDTLFFYLMLWSYESALKPDASWTYSLMFQMSRAFYYLLPTSNPILNQTTVLESSMRVTYGDLTYLLIATGYAATLWSFSYFSSLILLKRKSIT